MSDMTQREYITLSDETLDAYNHADKALTLINDFFDDYLTESEYGELKYDAQYRPEVIHARMYCIRELIIQVYTDLQDIHEPEKAIERYEYFSQRPKSYLRVLTEYRESQKEKPHDAGKANS